MTLYAVGGIGVSMVDRNNCTITCRTLVTTGRFCIKIATQFYRKFSKKYRNVLHDNDCNFVMHSMYHANIKAFVNSVHLIGYA